MTMMTDERLQELIEAYGAEPMAWPEAEREEAIAHIGRNGPAFENAIKAAQLLDFAVEGADVPDVPAGLAERIMAAAPAASPAREGLAGRLMAILMPNGARWPAGAALASLLVGVAGGYAAAAQSASDTYPTVEENAVYAALGYGDLTSYLDEDDG